MFQPSRPKCAADFIPVAKAVRAEMQKTSAEVDRTGDYPFDNIRLIEDSGLLSLGVPAGTAYQALRALDVRAGDTLRHQQRLGPP